MYASCSFLDHLTRRMYNSQSRCGPESLFPVAWNLVCFVVAGSQNSSRGPDSPPSGPPSSKCSPGCMMALYWGRGGEKQGPSVRSRQSSGEGCVSPMLHQKGLMSLSVRLLFSTATALKEVFLHLGLLLLLLAKTHKATQFQSNINT